jgi:hypothetical protein
MVTLFSPSERLQHDYAFVWAVTIRTGQSAEEIRRGARILDWLDFEWLQRPLAPGCVALAVAIVAWIGDHRRRKRKNIDAVGFVDWTTVFFIALMLAVLLLGAAARIWLKG